MQTNKLNTDESRIINDSELILSPEGRVYHLQLLPEEIADTIIFVGDPERVPKVSQYFDRIEFTHQAREFVTHTGFLNNKRLTVLSTGMCTGNIDIVINELDALVNIDLASKQIKADKKSLTIIRLGTSGCLQPSIPIDTIVLSSYAVGLDNLLHYYYFQPSADEEALFTYLNQNLGDEHWISEPYVVAGCDELIQALSAQCYEGITLTSPGFYAPQNRFLRAAPKIEPLLKRLCQLNWQGKQITNFEMETSGIYGMGAMLGHRCCSVNAIVANRSAGTYSKAPDKTVDHMIRMMLERIVELTS